MPKNRYKNKSPSHRVSPKKPAKRKDREAEQLEPKSLKRKRRKTDDGGYRALSAPPEAGPSRITLDSTPTPPDPIDLDGRAPPVPANPSPKGTSKVAGDLKATLQTMVEGNLSYPRKQKRLSKYLALDCEMVGVGPKGAQPSVARVSVVNYHGAVQMDEFVQQRERVVDYRTQHSGIRKHDLVNAKSFDEIQSRVVGLLKDKVLVGHAVFNDLQALSLAHPQIQTLDTQSYAWKFNVATTKRIALRHLVKQELGLTIQDGEHSSVTDARAAMAVFRLHEGEWEKGLAPVALPNTNTNKKTSKLGSEEGHDPQSPVELPRGWDGLNAKKSKNESKNNNKESKKNKKNKKLDVQPRLGCAWGGPEPGSRLGLGSVWAWDPEPDEWVGWDEPPESRPGLGWGRRTITRGSGRAWDGDDDIGHWGRDASKGWSW